MNFKKPHRQYLLLGAYLSLLLGCNRLATKGNETQRKKHVSHRVNTNINHNTKKQNPNNLQSLSYDPNITFSSYSFRSDRNRNWDIEGNVLLKKKRIDGRFTSLQPMWRDYVMSL